MAIADSGSPLQSGEAQLVIPFVALRKTPEKNRYETGIIVEVPEGSREVLVVVAAYSVTSETSCEISNAPLEAFAVLRITRRAEGEPDAGRNSDAGIDAGFNVVIDAGADAGADAGRDAGRPDAGSVSDAGMPDAGDGGTPDAGAIDAGDVDAGAPDSGTTLDGGDGG